MGLLAGHFIFCLANTPPSTKASTPQASLRSATANVKSINPRWSSVGLRMMRDCTEREGHKRLSYDMTGVCVVFAPPPPVPPFLPVVGVIFRIGRFRLVFQCENGRDPKTTDAKMTAPSPVRIFVGGESGGVGANKGTPLCGCAFLGRRNERLGGTYWRGARVQQSFCWGGLRGTPRAGRTE